MTKRDHRGDDERDANVDSKRPTVAPPASDADAPVVVADDSPALDAEDDDDLPPVLAVSNARRGALAAKARASSPPPSREPMSSAPNSSLLSMVNERSPSIVPMAGAADVEFTDLERAWQDAFGQEDAGAAGKDPSPSTPAAKPRALEASARPGRAGSGPPRSRSSRENKAITRPAPPDGPADPEREMLDRFSLGDYSGALNLAEVVLADNPSHAKARECIESCRSVLKQMYTARLGPLDRVPVVMVPPEQLRWLSIDHKAGFLLSHIDGVSSLEMILDVSGMPELDTLRILCELAQQRIISIR